MIHQPLDSLMNQLNLSNAELVKASTEQLSFKMVQKGRKGARLSPRIQDKILRALLTVKPGLKTRRRDLFRYDPSETVVEQIKSALALTRDKKIKYPQFIDLLAEAGINRYAVEVGPNRITFYGPGGEVHVEEGPAMSQSSAGIYNEINLLSAIADAQKGLIDHPAFLKRIHDAGIASYEVNIRDRKIQYKAEGKSYKEQILPSSSGLEIFPPAAENGSVSGVKVQKEAEKSAPIKAKKTGKIRIKQTGKFVKKHRTKKKNYSRGRL